MPEYKIIIPDITPLDKNELEKEFGQDKIEFSKVEQHSEGHPELILSMATFIVTKIAVIALTNWLIKRHRSKSFTYTVVKIHPNGRKEKVTLTYNEGPPPKMSILRQIAKAFDLETLLKLEEDDAK